MSDPIIRYILLESENGIEERIGAEQLSENTYKLLENPLFSCHINFGTIISAIPNKKGDLELIEIVKKSDYKTRQFLLPEYADKFDFARRIGDHIIAAGGTWEVVMGGIALIHLLKESEFDLDAFFTNNDFHFTEIK